MRQRIFVCQPIPEPAVDRMREIADVEIFPFSHREISVGELESAARRSDYIFCMHETPVTKSIAWANPELKAFAFGRVDPEIVDVASCVEAGMRLLEAVMPVRADHATSDFMVAHILNLAYRVIESDRSTRRDGAFQEQCRALEGLGTTNKTCAMFGYGRVARGATPVLRALGMRVLYTKRTRLPIAEEETLGIEWVADRDELLARGDFVCMGVNYEPANHKLMGAREFGLMKRTAFFINVARGRLVDEDAMITALQEGEIAGVGLDVYYYEPPLDLDPKIPELLREMENVTLTPHNGGATWDRRIKLTLAIAEVIVADIETQEAVGK